MGEFITRLTNFFSFQKTANVSAPGLLLAGSLLLFHAATKAPEYEVKAYDFDRAMIDDLVFPEDCLKLSQDYRTSGGTAGRIRMIDYENLQKRRSALDNCAYQLRSRIIAQQRVIAETAQVVDTNQKLAASFLTKYGEEALARNSMAAGTKAEADNYLRYANEARALNKGAEELVAFYTLLLPRLTKESDAISQISHSGEQEEPFADVTQRLSNRVMYFILLGIVCGLIIDPIMGLIQPILYSDDRIKRLNVAVSGVQVVPGNLQLTFYNMNYALGLGLITDADIETLRRRYMYPAQMLLNLILPGAVFLAGLGLYLNTHWPQIREQLFG